MIPALLLAAALAAPHGPSRAAPPPLDWSLAARLGANEDGEPALGVTWFPNLKFPVGVFLNAERVEWDSLSITPGTGALMYNRRPFVITPVERDDTKISIGVEWRIR